jgi:hypothetical protein
MTFTHVFYAAGIDAPPQGVRDANALLWSELEILLRIPTVGFAETAALFDDSFHANTLTSSGEIRKKEVSAGLRCGDLDCTAMGGRPKVALPTRPPMQILSSSP